MKSEACSYCQAEEENADAQEELSSNVAHGHISDGSESESSGKRDEIELPKSKRCGWTSRNIQWVARGERAAVRISEFYREFSKCVTQVHQDQLFDMQPPEVVLAAAWKVLRAVSHDPEALKAAMLVCHRAVQPVLDNDANAHSASLGAFPRPPADKK